MCCVRTDIFAGKLDAIVEQFDNLILAKTRIGRRRGSSCGGGYATIGGSACGSCLRAFEMVVVEAEEEGAGR